MSLHDKFCRCRFCKPSLIFSRERELPVAGIRQGVRRDHEALAASACRWRRIENSEPCAAYVLDAWRQRRRIERLRAMPPAERKRLLG